MATTNTYLNFNGNCEEAFNFYKSVFGGDFTYIGRFGEIPECETSKMPEADKSLIMHVSLPIGTSTLMGSDCGSNLAPSFKQGNNFSVSVTAGSKAEADSIFGLLAAGGQVIVPIGDMFWGDYFGMLTDKYGIGWMVSFTQQKG